MMLNQFRNQCLMTLILGILGAGVSSFLIGVWSFNVDIQFRWFCTGWISSAVAVVIFFGWMILLSTELEEANQ